MLKFPTFVILSRVEFEALLGHLEKCDPGCPILPMIKALEPKAKAEKK